MLELSKQIILFSSFVVLLPFGLALFWRKKLTGAMYVLFCFLILGVTTQMLGTLTTRNHIKNLPLLHLYTVIEFCWISWFYHVAMPEQFTRKKVIAIMLIFGLGATLNTAFLQPATQFNTYARTVESIIIITYSLSFFHKTIDEMQILKLEKEPLFWINIGFLLYFSGGTLLFVFSNFILPFKNSLNIYVWALHGIFSILLYLIQSIGIWMAAHKQT